MVGYEPQMMDATFLEEMQVVRRIEIHGGYKLMEASPAEVVEAHVKQEDALVLPRQRCRRQSLLHQAQPEQELDHRYVVAMIDVIQEQVQWLVDLLLVIK
ncbi:hypothetical protein L2E82_16749 [Cichorium intybus]|uniref:Uncharacterized protein n=1 Tax=Cichorium intybus TaxID=13427 RepID=A0ACB9F6E0_CICIN|nr:hypothetical protein L2E82_16749 [Cichorium intybus]